LQAFSPGIYPRSEALVQATRDLDRGRTTPEAVDEQLRRDVRELVRVQKDAGLDLLSDGMLTWQDLWRPLAEASAGLESRPLTRFLDTNTFYRAVLVEGEPRLETPLDPPDLPEGPWLGTLPSPFGFSRAAEGAVSAGDLAASVLAPQIDVWAEAGCAAIVLQEPFLAREPDGVGELADALEELPRDVPVHLHLVFGDAGPLLGRLADFPVEGVGIDFHRTTLDALPEDYPKTVLAGVIDAQSSAIEEPSELASFAESLQERRPAAVALVPNGDLQFVPESIAKQKLAALGAARLVLKEVLA
jgi:5-methyltetrahydropteroyltriglutamate--homocysteine methyltransferase